jgi:Reverse transcriptase (RNA-dependent DNA polymerase)
VHNSPTLRQSSIRLLVCLAACFGFQIFSTDISQAYLQSEDALLRKVYLNPGKEFELSPEHVLQLRPLYGLSDSGDAWAKTFTSHMKSDLGMVSTIGDISLFSKLMNGKLAGLAGNYVDDTIACGNEELRELSKLTAKRFLSSPRKHPNLRFAGIDIDNSEDGYYLSQKSFVRKLKKLNLDCTFDEFRSARAQLAWIVHTRPDVCVDVSMAAQVVEKGFCLKDVAMLNAAISRVVKTPDAGIRQQKLDISSLRLVAYSDSSFANNGDLTSQLGYMVCLVDKYKRCNIIHYSSYKSKRVTRSVLGGEIHAFADAFDCAFTLKHDLEGLLCQKVPVTILTDSRSLFDVITRNSATSERRLMIDVSATRQAYERHETSDVGFIRTSNNPADALTKRGYNAALMDILTTGRLDLPVEQYVIRT